MFVTKCCRGYATLPEFQLDGKLLTFVNQCTHLGRIIVANLNDKSYIISRKNSFCGKVTSVSCTPAVKFRLMQQYSVCYRQPTVVTLW